MKTSVSSAVILVLALLGSSGLVWFSAWQLDTPMIAGNPDFQAVVFTGFAVVSAVMGFIFGWRYPGKNHQYAQRAAWACADLLWLLLTLFAVGKLVGPVAQFISLRESQDAQRLYLQKQLITNIYTAEDQLCEMPDVNAPVCRVLRDSRRQLMMPLFKRFDANIVAKKIDEICVLTSCNEEPTLAVKNAASNLRSAYAQPAERSVRPQDRTWLADRIEALEKLKKQWAFEIVIVYVYVLLVVLLFGARTGRTAAEMRRITDDWRGRPTMMNATHWLS